MTVKIRLIISILTVLIVTSCANNNNAPEVDYSKVKATKVEVSEPDKKDFPVVNEMTFLLNEFVERTDIEMSLLTGTSVVHSIQTGDAGGLYEQFTLPAIEKLYRTGLIKDSFPIGERKVALVKVVAFYPDNLHLMSRGSKFDCFIIILGNAFLKAFLSTRKPGKLYTKVPPGKLHRVGLYDTRFSQDDPYAVVEGDLTDIIYLNVKDKEYEEYKATQTKKIDSNKERI